MLGEGLCAGRGFERGRGICTGRGGSIFGGTLACKWNLCLGDTCERLGLKFFFGRRERIFVDTIRIHFFGRGAWFGIFALGDR